jgi:hypothetical protein
LYRRVKSRPSPGVLTAEARAALENIKAQKEKEVSAAFLQYLAVTGIFAEWEKNRSVFESIHVGTNIIPNAEE